MEKNLRKLCYKIQKGEDLENGIPLYLSHLVNLYGQYSNLNFSMLYYTFYEYCKESDMISEEEETILKEFNSLVKSHFAGEVSKIKLTRNLNKIDNLRNKVIQRMHVLTSYTDLLEIYEYILNRVEYRFNEEYVSPEGEEEFIREVVAYIFDTKDNLVINEKIKEVIGQLPIRMTKFKYFDMLKESLTIYKGGDYTSLETFLYMIKTSAMLYKAEGMEEMYPKLTKAAEYFKNLDYSNISQEEYREACVELEDNVEWIQKKVDFYFTLEECINHLYVLFLTYPYQSMEGGYTIENLKGSMRFLLMPEEMDNYRKITKAINGYFLKANKPEIEEEIESLITSTEGKQENLIENLEQLEAYFSDISLNHIDLIESLDLKPMLSNADKASKLLSGSLFVDVSGKAKKEHIVNQDDINRMGDELINELSELFSTSQKVVVRAIMANTLSKLPIFFKDSNEVVEYINNALSSCRDLSEKTASIEIIRSFFEK